jgi:hypothetical protein
MDPEGDQRLSVELLISRLVEQASLITPAQQRFRPLLTANRESSKSCPAAMLHSDA